MAKPKKLPAETQAAAVREEWRRTKRSLDDIEADYPDLADGVDIVRAEQSKSPKPKGSGSRQPRRVQVAALPPLAL